ncbi:MAG: thioredoxin domain-containing protein [Chloroflexi bacterium]|nr:thioredoxin domain-containing protein [Chloroflexota bacterium]
MKKKEGNTLVAMATFVLGLLLGYFIWGSSPSTPAAPAQPGAEENQAPQAPAEPRDVPTEGFPSEGPDDAPIVIVEFSDFECPFCTKWHNEVYLPLVEEYPDQIKLVYRNFPLTSIHANAYLAAEAAMCADDQDAYWPYHEKLFESELGLREAALHEYAKQLGLDAASFETCLSSAKYSDFVKEDMNYAISIGVQSTPTFYVNGQLVIGAQPLQVFQQIIDEELAKIN